MGEPSRARAGAADFLDGYQFVNEALNLLFEKYGKPPIA